MSLETSASSPDANATAAAQPGLWAELRATLRGEQRSYTEGSLPRAVVLLAVPMVLELALESVFGLVDIFFVSRSLGAEAAAVVGVTESMLTIVFAIAIGLSAAATAMVARRIGEKRPEAASRVAVQAIALGLLAAAATGIFGATSADSLLRFMGMSESAIAGGASYTAIIYGSSVTIYLLFLINAIFRGAGDAMMALKALWLANAINIVLDPCLILGLGPFPELGLRGAAIATMIGRGTGVLFQLWMLFRGSGRLRIVRSALRLEPAILGRLLKISWTGILQYLIATAAWVGLVRLLSTFGDEALAGYQIALRLIIFTILPAWGLSNAAATLVGQNLGARQPERAARSAWLTAYANMAFLILVEVVFLVFPEALVGFFTDEAAVLAVGVSCLRWVSLGYPFYAFAMVLGQAFNGAGDTVTPTIMNFFCFWLLQIPLAYGLALGTGLGPVGVFLAITVAESVLALVAVVMFRRGKWKEKQV